MIHNNKITRTRSVRVDTTNGCVSAYVVPPSIVHYHTKPNYSNIGIYSINGNGSNNNNNNNKKKQNSSNNNNSVTGTPSESTGSFTRGTI